MRRVLFCLAIITLSACAKLPIQAITLTEAVIQEGKRMHELNIKMLNSMFNEKRERIDAFIKNEYTPRYLEEFNARIPEGINYQEEFPGMIQSIIPAINTRRDMMQSALESQRIKLVTALNADYASFQEASTELKRLIESGVKVNEERQKAFEQARELTQNKLDLNRVEAEIDKFIIKSGDIGGNINELNESINSLLNN